MTAALPLPSRDHATAGAGAAGCPEAAEPTAPRPLTPSRLHRPRLRPAPRRTPPFDDELTLDHSLPGRHLSLVGPADRPLPFVDDLRAPARTRLDERCDPFAPRPTGRGELPDPARFGRTLMQGIVEVLAGRRGAGQLAVHMSLGVQAGLSRDAGSGGRFATPGCPPRLRSLHVSEPADGIAELAAVIQAGPRVRAIAARLEGLDGRWRCVRLVVG